MRMHHDASHAFRFISLLLVCLATGACGKKAPPKPILPVPPPQIQGLQAAIRPQGVELTWPVPKIEGEEAPSGEKLGYRFVVLKAPINWEDRDCPGCPAPEPQEVDVIDMADPRPGLMEGGNIRWLDARVAVDSAYRYQVGVRDEKGRTASLSSPVFVKVVPSLPPAQGLRATPQREGISVRWEYPQGVGRGRGAGEELQFLLERRVPSESWTKVSPVPVMGTAFLDSAVVPSQNYDYRVTPLMTAEGGVKVWGEPSVLQSVESLEAVAPSPPETVWVIPVDGALEVHWVESEGKTGGYHVYRREDGELVRLNATPLMHPPYVDRSVKPNVVYHYAVSAVSPVAPHREGLLSKWVEIRSIFFK